MAKKGHAAQTIESNYNSSSGSQKKGLSDDAIVQDLRVNIGLSRLQDSAPALGLSLFVPGEADGCMPVSKDLLSWLLSFLAQKPMPFIYGMITHIHTYTDSHTYTETYTYMSKHIYAPLSYMYTPRKVKGYLPIRSGWPNRPGFLLIVT